MAHGSKLPGKLCAHYVQVVINYLRSKQTHPQTTLSCMTLTAALSKYCIFSYRSPRVLFVEMISTSGLYQRLDLQATAIRQKKTSSQPDGWLDVFFWRIAVASRVLLAGYGKSATWLARTAQKAQATQYTRGLKHTARGPHAACETILCSPRPCPRT